ncbi:MAG: C25 family peptidase propeptide domain-containing protein [Marinifilaceae bacterium]
MMKSLFAYFMFFFLLSCSVTKPSTGDNLIFTKNNLQTDQQFTPPNREITIIEGEYVQVKYEFKGVKLARKVHEGEEYFFVHIQNFGKMGQPGAPALPMRNDLLKVPQDSKPVLEIVESDYVVYDEITIYPASEPISDVYGAKPPAFYKDKRIYQKNQFFPENLVAIVSDQMASGNRFVRVQIRPVQLNPVTKKIRVYSRIVYRLKFQ